MKKYILFLLVLFAANAAFSQYINRQANALKDSLRTQIKMAVIDIAVDRADTATGQSLRLCHDVLGRPNDAAWLDIFVYQYVVISNNTSPGDNALKTALNTLWSRSAILNSRR